MIASEEKHKLDAEAADEDTAGMPAHAEKLRGCGVRIDFLLALTFALDMWEWKTWEVVQYLVKPATEGKGRCRFMELGVRGRGDRVHEPLLGRAVGRPGGDGVRGRGYESGRVVSWGARACTT